MICGHGPQSLKKTHIIQLPPDFEHEMQFQKPAMCSHLCGFPRIQIPIIRNIFQMLRQINGFYVE